MSLKESIRKIIPVSSSKADRLQRRTEKRITSQGNSSLRQLQKIQKQNDSMLTTLQKQNNGMLATLQKQNTDSLVIVQKQLSDILEKLDKLDKRVTALENQQDLLMKRQGIITVKCSEAVMAHVFHDTIANSRWLREQKFSPRNWALGYPAMYALYRILDEFRPGSILELGLGQSTRMISQYAATDSNIRHIVTESDASWVQFFQSSCQLPENSQIQLLDCAMEEFNGSTVRVFKGFSECYAGEKFDLICVDAPFRGDMKDFARIDALKMMPDILAKDFVILMDDSNSPQVKNTVDLMAHCLENHQIAFSQGRYVGERDCTVLCSESLHFLTTM